jgi:hypothetical protein
MSGCHHSRPISHPATAHTCSYLPQSLCTCYSQLLEIHFHTSMDASLSYLGCQFKSHLLREPFSLLDSIPSPFSLPPNIYLCLISPATRLVLLTSPTVGPSRTISHWCGHLFNGKKMNEQSKAHADVTRSDPGHAGKQDIHRQLDLGPCHSHNGHAHFTCAPGWLEVKGGAVCLICMCDV